MRYEYPDNRVTYRNTNESIESIVHALKPNNQDSILAVGGSGDQAFALLENAGEVHCVDKNPIQIDYIKMKANHLMSREYKIFLTLTAECDIYGTHEYLNCQERLDRIRDNLKNLRLTCGDIFTIARTEDFTKIYLSNAAGYNDWARKNVKRTFKKLAKMLNRLPKDGLAYVTNHEELCKALDEKYLKEPIETENGAVHIRNPKLLPNGIIIDPELTTTARKYEDLLTWQPTVYRRI